MYIFRDITAKMSYDLLTLVDIIDIILIDDIIKTI